MHLRKAIWFCALAMLAASAVLIGRHVHNKREFQARTSCVSNLHHISMFKKLYAQKHELTNGTSVTFSDVMSEEDRSRYRCRKGGTYTINAIGIAPSCSYTQAVWHKRYWHEFGGDPPGGRLVPWYHVIPD